MPRGIPAHAVDITIPVDQMTLVAVKEGLGMCRIGKFYQDQVKQVIDIAERCKVLALPPVGYTGESARKKPRKSLEETVCYDAFVGQCFLDYKIAPIILQISICIRYFTNVS